MVCLEEVSTTLVVHDSQAAMSNENFKQSCYVQLFTKNKRCSSMLKISKDLLTIATVEAVYESRDENELE